MGSELWLYDVPRWLRWPPTSLAIIGPSNVKSVTVIFG
jgi:hypothetical protein